MTLAQNIRDAREAKQLTSTIADQTVTLHPGRQYLASRPMASHGRKVYPVSIWLASHDGFEVEVEPAFVVDDLDYDEANAFLAEFNNGTVSFEGRQWN